eukprot:6646450-Ditylum_brightwellii.AAC.1
MKFLLAKFVLPVFSFYHLHIVQYPTQAITDGVILIVIRVRLPWVVYPPMTSPPVCPYRHGLVTTRYPSRYENVTHVGGGVNAK